VTAERETELARAAAGKAAARLSAVVRGWERHRTWEPNCKLKAWVKPKRTMKSIMMKTPRSAADELMVPVSCCVLGDICSRYLADGRGAVRRRSRSKQGLASDGHLMRRNQDRMQLTLLY
jgi:hypothetical protein